MYQVHWSAPDGRKGHGEGVTYWLAQQWVEYMNSPAERVITLDGEVEDTSRAAGWRYWSIAL